MKLKEKIRDSFLSVQDSNSFILGKNVELFERNWASINKANYSVGVANGMDAIEIILRTLNIGKGDEVILTSLSAFASALAIIKVGAKPVFVDIEISSGLASLEHAKKVFTSKTRAVLLVHLFGQLKNINAWLSLCKENNIPLIEDCAQSHLAQEDGKFAGTHGIAGAFSFYPTKNLGCLGDGGAILTNDKNIYESAIKIRNYGQSDRYKHDTFGMNSRLDELQAAVLNEKLKWLEEFNDKRRKIANSYYHKIHNHSIKLLDKPHSEKHVYHLFVILTNERDRLKDYLFKNGVYADIHYPVPMFDQEFLKKQYSNIDLENFKNVMEFTKTCLSIPICPYLTNDEINKIINLLNEF